MNTTSETLEPINKGDNSTECILRVADEMDDAVELMENILWSRLRSVRSKLFLLLSSRDNNPLLGASFSTYNELPAAQQARILLSPELTEFYSMAFTDETKTDPQVSAILTQSRILDLILREKAIHEMQLGHASDYLLNTKEDCVYSPLGDTYVLRDRYGQWMLKQSPMLAGVIAIDFDSPVALNYEPRSGILSQPRLNFTDTEKQAVAEKLNKSLALIDSVTPVYGFLIRNFVRRIIIRKSIETIKSSDGRSVFSSEHAPQQPGALRLLNTHLPDLSADALMENLLHESIHNFLAAWESVNGLFVKSTQKYRPISPWSGNSIPNSSFIHATFIYYMCYRMYMRHLETIRSDESRKAHICKRLAVFISGFMINHHSADQLVLEAPITEELRDVIGLMQARIKKAYTYIY